MLRLGQVKSLAMKIVLSRKGFDSSFGGVASPILPGGILLSLPIPSRESPISYGDLHIDGYSIGAIVEDLTRGRIRSEHSAHLDPDLRASMYSRLPGWRPLFGQAGAAQSHLEHMGVGPGDLFLFFGWFRQTKRVAGDYRFVRGAPSLDVIWGWLQVDTILFVGCGDLDIPEWAKYHPHFHGEFKNNAVYVARETLRINGIERSGAGGGVFAQYRESLRLSAPGHPRSI
jgi:hypothetical protein